LLAQHALAPDGVQNLQQQRPKQLLRRNRRSAGLRKNGVKAWRQLSQNRVNELADHPQRVVRRYTVLKRDVAEQLVLFTPIWS
jgi:hypothetical protein